MKIKEGDVLYSKYDIEITAMVILVKDGYAITDRIKHEYPYGLAVKVSDINKDDWYSDRNKVIDLLLKKERGYFEQAKSNIEKLEKMKA